MKVMLWAKLKKRQKILIQATSYVEHKGVWDADALHEAMGEVCRALDIALPLVLQKHVQDANAFSRVVFRKSDFVEPVSFDEFELELVAEEEKKGGKV